MSGWRLWAILAGGLAAILISAAVFQSRPPKMGPDILAPAHAQAALGRTLNLIQTSKPDSRKTLRVLFYGQSIVASGWHEKVVAHWKTKYPHTNFIVENLAIGGFASQNLVRTVARDVRVFYPDLIIFHVYGDDSAYEEIIKTFRRETAADIIVQTDHGSKMPAEKCPTGFQLRIPAPPGCKGLFWYRQKNWEDEMSYHRIPAMAEKYTLAVQPQRTAWRTHLTENDLLPAALLSDHIHLNDRGRDLMAAMLIAYFDDAIASLQGAPGVNVETIAPTAETIMPDTGYKLTFSGTRLEAELAAPLPAGTIIRVDGRDTRAITACYAPSRPTAPPGALDWPAIRQIGFAATPVEENWTARISGVNEDFSDFTYTLHGDVTGNDGEGTAGAIFTSASGRVVFDPSDWMFSRAQNSTPDAAAGGYEMRWSVDFLCDDYFRMSSNREGDWRVRQTIVTGLSGAGPHEVEFALPDGTAASIDRFISYRPALAE